MFTSEYRYERKFSTRELSKFEIESIVKMHPALFTEIFYQRNVNNIYFDTINLDNYYDNIEGATDRMKVRVRWYDDLFGFVQKPVLEIKIKKGFLGKKISIPLPSFELQENTKITDILNPVNNLQDSLRIDFKSLKPSLLNRYSRNYYQSSNKRYRVTIDSDQSYYKINQLDNFFLNKIRDKDTVILELKYNQESDFGANDITSKFPFRVTKSSKYVNGVQKVLEVAH